MWPVGAISPSTDQARVVVSRLRGGLFKRAPMIERVWGAFVLATESPPRHEQDFLPFEYGACRRNLGPRMDRTSVAIRGLMLSKPTILAVWEKNWYQIPQLGQPSNQLGSGIERTWKWATVANLCRRFFPDMGANMKREERDTRALIGSDQCVIDPQWFLCQGILKSRSSAVMSLCWGLWASTKGKCLRWKCQGIVMTCSKGC